MSAWAPGRAATVAIALLVVAAHIGLVQWLQDQLPGARRSLVETARLQVQFVRLLRPLPPLAVASLPPPSPVVPRGDWLAVPELPPILASVEAPELAENPDAAASTPRAVPMASAAHEPTPEPTPEPVAAAPAFEWPPSTRLRYRLSGHYRGPIDGTAQVEWLRRGDRYQVFLDVQIGMPIAPLITRQMRSEGRVTPAGLWPTRFEERTRLLWREPRSLTITLDADHIQLPGRRRVPRPAAVQDAVSQFVQLTWRFTLDPALLSTGRVLTVPLALPSGVSDWTYDVGLAQTFHTPAGPVDGVHLRPRRQARPGGDLVAEMWFAPALQHLPVRILIQQGEGSFVDLVLDGLPEQEAASMHPTNVTGAPNR